MDRTDDWLEEGEGWVEAKSEVYVLGSWVDDGAINFSDHSAVLVKPTIESREGGPEVDLYFSQARKCLMILLIK